MCKGKKLVGGPNWRCELGGVGSEEPENLVILLGRRDKGKRSGRSCGSFRLVFLLQGCERFLWIAFAGQGHCAKVVNRLFESGRRCGSNCFKVVVCLRILSSVRIKLTMRCTLGLSLAHSPMK